MFNTDSGTGIQLDLIDGLLVWLMFCGVVANFMLFIGFGYWALGLLQ